MTDNPESKDGSIPSLPPKLNLRKKNQDAEDQAKVPEVSSSKLRPASASPTGSPVLKPQPPAGGGAGASSYSVKAAPFASSPSPAAPDTAKPESQTVHIQIPRQEAARPSPTVAMKPLSRAALSSPAAPSVSSSEGQSAGEKKKETSRIPLSAAKPEVPTVRSTPASDGPVKTIRIRPKSATAQTQKVAEPGVLPGGPDTGSSKKQTSRISLEAAFASDTDTAHAPTGAGPRPKTIRLKRPSEASTVKVTPRPQGMEAAPEAKLEETSKLDLPPVGPSQAAPTQRKTIRVKRPTQQPGVASPGARTVSTVRVSSAPGATGKPGVPTTAAGGVPVATAPVRADEPNVVFSIFAIAAMLVMMVTLYMFSAQVFGPNSSYTQYSYAVEGPNLGWPGKLPPPQQQ